MLNMFLVSCLICYVYLSQTKKCSLHEKRCPDDVSSIADETIVGLSRKKHNEKTRKSVVINKMSEILCEIQNKEKKLVYGTKVNDLWKMENLKMMFIQENFEIYYM